MPKASTKATAKYQEKAGYAAKTYKLKTNVTDQFKAACLENKESQAAVLTRLMSLYSNGEKQSCFFCRLKK